MLKCRKPLSLVLVLFITFPLSLGLFSLPSFSQDFEGAFSFDPDTKVLEIYGNGEMGFCEWDEFRYDVVCVVISDGITTISDYAFSDMFSLTEITIPDSVTYIGESAFSGCVELTEITLPANLLHIGNYAFFLCMSLTSVTIPNGVTKIGTYAFSDCSSLESVTIPDTVTSIEDKAFFETAIYNDESNRTGGVLYIGNHLIDMITAEDSVTVKEGTKVIADYAFSYETLNSIILPDTLTHIGEGAFAFRNLSQLTLCDSVVSIGDGAFDSVDSVAFYGSKKKWDTLASGHNALLAADVVFYPAETAENPLEDIKFSYSCSFYNSLTLNYYVSPGMLEEFDSFYLLVEKDVYDKHGNLSVVQAELSAVLTGEEYRFSFAGIAAAEVGNEIRATLVANKDGTEYISSADVYSVKTYAYNRLAKSTDDSFKTLLVDMLNYASATQSYFGIRTDALVNADLTPEQRAFATNPPPAAENKGTVCETPGAAAVISGKSVVFGNNVEVKFYLDLNDIPDKTGISLRIVTDKGEETIPFGDFSYNASTGEYSVKYCGLAAAELRDLLTVTVYDKGEPISDTVIYGVETYCCNRLAVSDDELFKALLLDLLRYADSAFGYFYG